MKTWTFPERPAGDGPWTSEPDKAQWIDEATGLDCLIVRNRIGSLCGYVGVPPGHPCHGMDYSAVCELAEIDVHGGLTFADSCQEGEGDQRVCHVPEPGRPDEVWWLGFDCAHAGDLSPGMPVYDTAGIKSWRQDVYREFGYVHLEVTGLARQLAAVGAS